ncbi:MAG: hypothetical protein A2055_00975 [Deltaproteobacteria bacterium GWA2_47_9]|nr:MAG: hypothetical protein A2055_00975 [Deltaproteobacteria bacterium GWA2_47_9]
MICKISPNPSFPKRGIMECPKKHAIANQKGVSIVAVIATMLILSVMGVTLISLVTTGSDISINQLQSEKAFNVAEGGKEYILANRTFPNYSLTSATNLGAGNFTVATPTYLTGAVAAGNTTINVNSTSGFAAAPGRLVIDSEVMTYTAMTANTFTIAAATADHFNGNAVYPVTTLTADPGVAGTTLNVGSTTGFIVPGSVKIDNEYLYCTGSTAVAFIGCQRGYRASTPAAHGIGSNVFQYVITSTGIVGNAQRVVRFSADRIGGETVTDGDFPNLSKWNTEVITKSDGSSSLDGSIGNPANSLISQTTTCTGAACRGLWFQGYREQTLTFPIPSGANVTLRLDYSKSVNKTGGGSATDMSVVILYQGGGTATIWSDTVENTTAFTSITQTFVSANIITGIRLVYNLKNPSGPTGNDSQRKVWFDNVSLTSPGGPGCLTWQESY